MVEAGGEGGIRTHGTRKGSTVFETARFNHSRTSPHLNYLNSLDLRPLSLRRFYHFLARTGHCHYFVTIGRSDWTACVTKSSALVFCLEILASSNCNLR